MKRHFVRFLATRTIGLLAMSLVPVLLEMGRSPGDAVRGSGPAPLFTAALLAGSAFRMDPPGRGGGASDWELFTGGLSAAAAGFTIFVFCKPATATWTGALGPGAVVVNLLAVGAIGRVTIRLRAPT